MVRSIIKYLDILWKYIKAKVYRLYWTMWGRDKSLKSRFSKIDRIRQSGYWPYFNDDVVKELDSYGDWLMRKEYQLLGCLMDPIFKYIGDEINAEKNRK